MTDQNPTPDQLAPVDFPPDRWATFISWHRTEAPYREIYVRATRGVELRAPCEG